jgi:hypothetical protein
MPPPAPQGGQGRKQKTDHPPSTLDKRRLICAQLDERYRSRKVIRTLASTENPLFFQAVEDALPLGRAGTTRPKKLVQR